MSLRPARHVLFVILFAMVGALLAPQAVSASAPTASRVESAGDGVIKRTKSIGQLDGGQVYLRNIKMCARWTFRASWKVQVAVDKNQRIWSMKNPRMLDPTLGVKFTRTCALDARARRSSRVEAKTYVSASNFSMRLCSWNPSIDVGVPWSIAVGVAPTCSDDTDRASRIRTLEPKKPAKSVSISASGRAAEWEKFGYWHDDEDDRSMRACFKLRVYLDVSNAAGTKSDSATRSPVTDNFCLPIGSWAMAIAGRS